MNSSVCILYVFKTSPTWMILASFTAISRCSLPPPHSIFERDLYPSTLGHLEFKFSLVFWMLFGRSRSVFQIRCQQTMQIEASILTCFLVSWFLFAQKVICMLATAYNQPFFIWHHNCSTIMICMISWNWGKGACQVGHHFVLAVSGLLITKIG